MVKGGALQSRQNVGTLEIRVQDIARVMQSRSKAKIMEGPGQPQDRTESGHAWAMSGQVCSALERKKQCWVRRTNTGKGIVG